MCELLLIARNRSDDLDFGPGMTVDVKNDGAIWGRMESKQQWIKEGNVANDWPSQGLFLILKMPNVAVSRALSLIDTQVEDDAGTPQFDLHGPRTFRRRRWRFVIDSLPPPARNALVETGEHSTAAASVRAFFRRIRDNGQYQGFD